MTTKKVTRSRGAMIAAVAATAAAVVGGIWYATESSAKASTTPPAGPPPSGQMPVWTQLTPVADGNGGYMVLVPAGASFAFSDGAGDPYLTAIVNGLNSAANNGNVNSTVAYQPGTAAPAFWPADGLGTNAYRASGVSTTAFNLSLATHASATFRPQVWVVTGYN